MVRKVYTISLIPADIAEWARSKGFTHTLVPTEGYTLTKCHECNGDAWIGPMQLETYQSNPAPFALLCIRCIIASGEPFTMVDLGNPASARIERLP